MKPRKLTICGWGPYKDKVEVDFDKFDRRGVFLITGPTGAGKTTIFDAISYALYGALSGEVRDKEKNSVRSDFADGDTPTYVELDMVHAGKEYRIRRNPEYLRPKKRQGGERSFTKEKENAILYLPEDKVIEGTKEVNAYIKDLLVLDHNQFKQLSMIAQGEFARLLTAPPKDKTKIFREIFGTGIYERFTTALSAKAKKHYCLVAEQKNKLEEDIRILQASVAESELSEEQKEYFGQINGAQWGNREEIEKRLEELKTITEESGTEQQKAYEALEAKLEEKNAYLTRKQEENKLIIELQNALEEQAKIQAMEAEVKQKELDYHRAVNAGWVDGSFMKLQQEEKALVSLEREEERLKVELRQQKQKLDELAPFREKKEEIKDIIRVLTERENISLQCKREETDILQMEKAKAELVKKYEAREEASRQQKAVYEGALLNQRRAAIGLAATMLVQGEPCPVCGSKEHPKPATLESHVLSEQELEECKQEYEAKEKETAESYQQVVVIGTQLKEAQLRREELEKEGLRLERQLAEATNPVCMEFIAMGSKKAGEKWQENVETMQTLQTLQKEKEKRMQQLDGDKKGQLKQIRESEEVFAQTLKQYEFGSKEDYQAASLEKGERESLKKQIADYQQRRAANNKLVEHLKGAVKEQQPMDLAPLEEEIRENKLKKQRLLIQVKKWEQFAGEVKRARRLCREKLGKIEEQSKEYGVIKELENIATGNNAKKLVFEQYVLAGYFEEILNAANVRLRKMTAGRYEMYRTKEVGDGRVKDNLEIEVLDFYTGKHRSIRTLSGGESFKASLSLALGLSDVIQAMSGGIRVDTLFIDEGFGALDSESLDQACETLMGLVETERLVGIISHVPELRERISKQIVIERAGSGSSLKVVEGHGGVR